MSFRLGRTNALCLKIDNNGRVKHVLPALDAPYTNKLPLLRAVPIRIIRCTKKEKRSASFSWNKSKSSKPFCNRSGVGQIQVEARASFHMANRSSRRDFCVCFPTISCRQDANNGPIFEPWRAMNSMYCGAPLCCCSCAQLTQSA